MCDPRPHLQVEKLKVKIIRPQVRTASVSKRGPQLVAPSADGFTVIIVVQRLLILVVCDLGVDSWSRASGSVRPMPKCVVDAASVQRKTDLSASPISQRYYGNCIWP